MKYLKKSNRPSSLQLLDLMDLQIELLEEALDRKAIDQYSELCENVEELTQQLLAIADKDYAKFQRILDNTNSAYAKLYTPEIANQEHVKVMMINPLVKKITTFYCIGMDAAYIFSNREDFQLFYSAFKRMFIRLTEFSDNSSLPKINVDDSPFSFVPIKYGDFYDGMLNAYSEYSADALHFKMSDRTTNVQMYFKEMLNFKLYVDCIFDEAFDHSTHLFKTITFLEYIIWEHVVKDGDEKAFRMICLDLHSLAADYRDRNEKLYRECPEELRGVARVVDEMTTRYEYGSFLEKLKGLGEPLQNHPFLKKIREVAEYNRKYVVLREMIVQLGGRLLQRKKYNWLYWLLFSRQPLAADFYSSEPDFFSIREDYLTLFLVQYMSVQRKWAFEFRRRSIKKETNQFIYLWLFRNYVWKRKENHEQFHLLSISEERDYIGDIISEILEERNELTHIIRRLLRRESMDITEYVTGFFDSISSYSKLVKKNSFEKRKEAHPIPRRIKDFSKELNEQFYKKSSLLNILSFFSLDKPSEAKQISCGDTVDKQPFIEKKLRTAEMAINAFEVTRSLFANELAMRVDHYLVGELQKRTTEEYTTMLEMEKLLQNGDFADKLIISHYVLLGTELLEDRITNIRHDNLQTVEFRNRKGHDVEIYSINHFSRAKFMLILDRRVKDELLHLGYPKVTVNLNEKDPMAVDVEASITIEEWEAKGNVGTFYYLR